MSFEQELIEQRREKLRRIEALGYEAYPHRFDSTHTVERIVAEYSAKTAEELAESKPTVRICGRLTALRGHGKAGFADVTQTGVRLQIYVRKDAVGDRGFELLQLLDLGDWVGVEGYLFRTRTGELSVHVTALTLLAKAMLPMPEKWHGLQDVEARYRQRYLDLLANPEVNQAFRTRSKLVRSLRSAMDRRGFIEVETPMMQSIAGGAAARPFRTHHNALDIDLYLRIAPELYLKRLIVGGLDRVYEINRNFRNEGISTRHNPEYTMLEFYQAYADYRVLMDFSEELFQEVAMETIGTLKFDFGEHAGENAIDFGKFARYTMREAICAFWPGASSQPAAVPKVEDFADPLRTASWISEWNRRNPQQPVTIGVGPSPGEAVAALFEAVCEDKLVQPTFIYEFPVEVSPLAKSKADEPQWVERFELYIAGMEILNAYSELNDPEEQRRRFEMQMSMREKGDAEAHAMDEDYVRALCYGMPPTAGEGIGVDRLAMLLTNSRSIRDVILFPLMRPETAESDG